jgi:hypothetical protein
MACISVHRWRRARREERRQLIHAAYRNPQGPISVAGHMDPNMAYLVTYPDGRQVLVPPPNQQQQQYAPIPQQHGYYAPPGQQQGMQQVSNGKGYTVAPVTATPVGADAAAGGLAGQQNQATRNLEHSPVSQISQPQQHGFVPEHTASNSAGGSESLYARSTGAADAVPERR